MFCSESLPFEQQIPLASSCCSFAKHLEHLANIDRDRTDNVGYVI